LSFEEWRETEWNRGRVGPIIQACIVIKRGDDEQARAVARRRALFSGGQTC